MKTRKVLIREAAKKVAEQQKRDPLDVLEEIYSDPRAPKSLVIDASKAALPYLKRRMPQTIELRDLSDLTDEELRRLAGSEPSDVKPSGS